MLINGAQANGVDEDYKHEVMALRIDCAKMKIYTNQESVYSKDTQVKDPSTGELVHDKKIYINVDQHKQFNEDFELECQIQNPDGYEPINDELKECLEFLEDTTSAIIEQTEKMKGSEHLNFIGTDINYSSIYEIWSTFAALFITMA